MYIAVSHSQMKQMQEIVKRIKKVDKYVYCEITNIEGDEITYRLVTKLELTDLMKNYLNEII